MHSPWGILGHAVRETGYTWHYLLWKISWANVMLMMADRSNFKTIKPEDRVIEENGADLLNRFKTKGGKI
jgi:hypothetical protein